MINHGFCGVQAWLDDCCFVQWFVESFGDPWWDPHWRPARLGCCWHSSCGNGPKSKIQDITYLTLEISWITLNNHATYYAVDVWMSENKSPKWGELGTPVKVGKKTWTYIGITRKLFLTGIMWPMWVALSHGRSSLRRKLSSQTHPL